MKLYKEFAKARLELEKRAAENIQDCGTRAYEYGILTVKNAFLVAGAGLVAVPAIVGLNSSVEIITEKAALAGALFALSLILALVATYLIHINWMCHTSYWEERKETEYDYLLQIYDDDETVRQNAEFKEPKVSPWINVTFYLPHVLAVIFTGCISMGWYTLYSAFYIF